MGGGSLLPPRPGQEVPATRQFALALAATMATPSPSRCWYSLYSRARVRNCVLFKVEGGGIARPGQKKSAKIV